MARNVFPGAVMGGLLFLLGCGPTTVPTDNEPTHDETTDVGDRSTNDLDPTADDPAFEFDQTLARAIAEDAASVLAQSTIAVLTVAKLQAIFEGGAPMPMCPVLGTTIDPGAILLTLDYGAGCTPAPYIDLMLNGTVTGNAFTSVSSFETVLDSINLDGTPIDGALTGTFTREDTTTRFSLTPSLTRDGSTTHRGSATVVVDETSGSLVIATASVIVTASELSYSVVIDEATIDPNGPTGATPTAGTATVTNLLDSFGAVALTVSYGT